MATKTDVSPLGELISSTDKADMVGNTNRMQMQTQTLVWLLHVPDVACTKVHAV